MNGDEGAITSVMFFIRFYRRVLCPLAVESRQRSRIRNQHSEGDCLPGQSKLSGISQVMSLFGFENEPFLIINQMLSSLSWHAMTVSYSCAQFCAQYMHLFDYIIKNWTSMCLHIYGRLLDFVRFGVVSVQCLFFPVFFYPFEFCKVFCKNLWILIHGESMLHTFFNKEYNLDSRILLELLYK